MSSCENVVLKQGLGVITVTTKWSPNASLSNQPAIAGGRVLRKEYGIAKCVLGESHEECSEVTAKWSPGFNLRRTQVKPHASSCASGLKLKEEC